HDHLHTEANAAVLAGLTGLDHAAAASALHRHIGVCYDICHGALQYEEPGEVFVRFWKANIRVAKLQLSSALRIPRVSDATRRELAAFDDGVYLHQVVQRQNGSFTRFVDLAPAFEA